jgi:hypothetical protein
MPSTFRETRVEVWGYGYNDSKYANLLFPHLQGNSIFKMRAAYATMLKRTFSFS